MQNEPVQQENPKPLSIEERIGSFLDEPEFDEPQHGVQETQEAEELEEEKAEQVEDPDEQEDEPEGEESVSVESLAELAEHIGADVADLYNLKIPVNGPDGQRTEITLGEYKDSYREMAMVKAERERNHAETEKARAELNQKAQFLDVAYNQANMMIQAAERQLLGDIGGLEQLQTTDPTQYVLKRQQLTDKQNELYNLRQQAIQHYQQQQQQTLQQQEAQRQQLLQQESQRLIEVIPAWKDEKVRSAEQAELTNFLVNSGFPEEEVSTISRAIIVDIARKAMLYDKMKKVEPNAKKKVVTIGKKVIQSSAKPNRSAVKVTKFQQARKSIRSAKGKRSTDQAVANLLENHFLEDL